MAREMFRAHKGERVDIDCYTPDPDEKALYWYKVGIRGTTGWVVDSLPDDRLANIPLCGVSGSPILTGQPEVEPVRRA
jgi:hypothetical protein